MLVRSECEAGKCASVRSECEGRSTHISLTRI